MTRAAGLHRQRHQVPAAGQPQSRSPTRSRPASRSSSSRSRIIAAARRRRARQVRGAVAAAHHRADHAPARPRLRVPRRLADADVPSGVPASQPPAKREVWEDMKKVRDLLQALAPVSRFVSVAVPVPALDVLTYRLPDECAGAGGRARASTCRSGPAVSPASSSTRAAPAPDRRVRCATSCAVRDSAAFVPPSLRGAGAVGGGVLPGGSRRRAGLGVAAARAHRGCARRSSAAASRCSRRSAPMPPNRLALGPRCAPPGDGDADGRAPRPPPARGAAALLAGTPPGLPVAALADRGIIAATVARLAQAGLVAVTSRDRRPRPVRRARDGAAGDGRHVSLTGEQQAAARRPRAARRCWRTIVPRCCRA